jgi:hypothetical protein
MISLSIVCLRSAWRACKMFALSALCWASLHAAALAQAPAEPGKVGGNYVISYVLVVGAIGAGMTLVLRPSRRGERAPIKK